MKFKFIKLCKTGVWFVWKGDEVEYIFPWNREEFNYKFLSLGFGSTFKSLKDLDALWEDYFDHYNL